MKSLYVIALTGLLFTSQALMAHDHYGDHDFGDWNDCFNEPVAIDYLALDANYFLQGDSLEVELKSEWIKDKLGVLRTPGNQYLTLYFYSGILGISEKVYFKEISSSISNDFKFSVPLKLFLSKGKLKRFKEGKKASKTVRFRTSLKKESRFARGCSNRNLTKAKLTFKNSKLMSVKIKAL